MTPAIHDLQRQPPHAGEGRARPLATLIRKAPCSARRVPDAYGAGESLRNRAQQQCHSPRIRSFSRTSVPSFCQFTITPHFLLPGVRRTNNQRES